MSFSPALTLYRGATALLGPLAGAWLSVRTRKGKEDPTRVGERYGRYTQTRPDGALVWLHAASVGEANVALALIDALAAREPDLNFLLSTGTRTSAAMAAQRAPHRTTHIYAPLDRRGAVRRFLEHWRPDLGVFLESELWPNLILESEAKGVPLALVNARMSPRSLRRWTRWRVAGRRLLAAFAYVAAADARTGAALSALRGAAAPINNLKLAAPAPHVDAAARDALTAEIGARPVWLAASTHKGEDEIAIEAHAILRAERPDALLIIAPRHPERGEAIAAGAAPRRANGDPIAAAPIYVADTLGELGTIYSVAPVALVAGSLCPHLKGHNPIEPAKLGAAIITGPYIESFEDVYKALFAAGGAVRVSTAQELAEHVARLWRDAGAHAAQTSSAREMAHKGAQAFDDTITHLLALLPAGAQTQRSADAPA